MKAVAILGAGWSAAAGRPLAGQLFDEMPFATSAEARRLQLRVQHEWRRWRGQHEDGFAEEFVSAMTGSTLWPYIVQYVGARLAEPDQVRLANELRYGERVDKPSPAKVHPQFMEVLLRDYHLIGVVTTNYDLLAERALRHRPTRRPVRPGFFYAGISARRLQGASTFAVRRKWVDVVGTVPVCKLHGSLNWWLSGSALSAYADCRPAFRSHDVSYIVAPAPEKVIPAVLSAVWSEARALLEQAEEWVVVGYSAPAYDTAIAEMLSTSASGALQRVRVIDPMEAVIERYRALTGKDIRWDGSLEQFCTASKNTHDHPPGRSR